MTSHDLARLLLRGPDRPVCLPAAYDPQRVPQEVREVVPAEGRWTHHNTGWRGPGQYLVLGG